MLALTLIGILIGQPTHRVRSPSQMEIRWICDYVLHHFDKGEIDKALTQLRLAESLCKPNTTIRTLRAEIEKAYSRLPQKDDTPYRTADSTATKKISGLKTKL